MSDTLQAWDGIGRQVEEIAGCFIVYRVTRKPPGVALVNISNREIFMGNSNTLMYISFKH